MTVFAAALFSAQFQRLIWAAAWMRMCFFLYQPAQMEQGIVLWELLSLHLLHRFYCKQRSVLHSILYPDDELDESSENQALAPVFISVFTDTEN